MNEFQEYRNAFDEMERDLAVQGMRAHLQNAQEALKTAEESYRARMNDAEQKIKEAVLEQGDSVTLHNVFAKYTKGRTTTAWKNVADALNPPKELIEEHSKTGEPSVSVKPL